MVRLAATALRSDLSNTLSRVSFQGERIMLERSGKAVAGLVSADDLHLLEYLENRMDLRAARAALKEPGRTPWRTVKKKLGL